MLSENKNDGKHSYHWEGNVLADGHKSGKHPYQWDDNILGDCKKTSKGDEDLKDQDLLESGCDAGQRTTVVVRFQGDVEVMVTPLALESLQR